MIKIPEGSELATGIVIEALANAMFRVEVDEIPENYKTADNSVEQSTIIAQLSGKMRLNRIRIIVGDKVEILFDQYGGRPRIIRRI
jgi:translation initiation factor IF-1